MVIGNVDAEIQAGATDHNPKLIIYIIYGLAFHILNGNILPRLLLSVIKV